MLNEKCAAAVGYAAGDEPSGCCPVTAVGLAAVFPNGIPLAISFQPVVV